MGGGGEDVLGCVGIGAKVERVTKATSARHGAQQVNRAPVIASSRGQVYFIATPS